VFYVLLGQELSPGVAVSELCFRCFDSYLGSIGQYFVPYVVVRLRGRDEQVAQTQMVIDIIYLVGLRVLCFARSGVISRRCSVRVMRHLFGIITKQSYEVLFVPYVVVCLGSSDE